MKKWSEGIFVWVLNIVGKGVLDIVGNNEIFAGDLGRFWVGWWGR